MARSISVARMGMIHRLSDQRAGAVIGIAEGVDAECIDAFAGVFGLGADLAEVVGVVGIEGIDAGRTQ